MKKRDHERLQRRRAGARNADRSTRSAKAPAGKRAVLRLGLAAAVVALAAGAVATGLWLTRAPQTAAAAVTSATSGDEAGVTFNGKTYTNRLIHSHDPYLLMHAHNPVNWYPWGPEALAAAKREHKPIFISIGYSTCYWCHVAERQIYSNPKIAKLMNQWFVNIKVDREQRPDIDRVYMLATQIMTSHGGWPNNVFLTPDLKPFFAGSYFPPTDQGGRPGFPTILAGLHRAWTGEQHAKVVAVGERVDQALQQVESRTAAGGDTAPAPRQWLAAAVQQASSNFDARRGGFSGGGRTMFPQEPLLAALLAAYRQNHDQHALAMLTQTLTAMAAGGVMDQLAGGFHRYSTEPTWSIPHFEKMLYDNAQLLGLYAQAWAITKQPLFKQTALRTARYLTRDMRAPGGAFYSAQDSQVDNVEGVSYVWTRKRIESVLGAADAKRFFALYTLTPMPQSFGGQKQSPGGVLRLDRDQAQALKDKKRLADAIKALAPLRAKLLAVRVKRPQPARDEKLVTADNGLVILGLVQAGKSLHDPALIHTAAETAQWEWHHAFDAKTGLLRHQFFHGRAGNTGFLDDYALLGQSFLALQQATGNAVWQTRARRLADAMLKRFARTNGSLATTVDTTDLLIAPPVEGDSVQPSGQSAAVTLLLNLSVAGGDPRYATAARRALAPLSAQIAARPSGWGALVASLSRPARVAALDHAEQTPASQVTAGLPSSADHVQAQAHLTAAKTGSDLRVSIVVDSGYHINANPASDPDLIPTQLSVVGTPNLHVRYPQAQTFKAPFAPKGIAVYSGQVLLRAHLPQAPAPATPVKASLRVQACNDRFCLAPATIGVPVAATSD